VKLLWANKEGKSNNEKEQATEKPIVPSAIAKCISKTKMRNANYKRGPKTIGHRRGDYGQEACKTHERQDILMSDLPLFYTNCWRG
jgi:hypothetical protein